MTPSATAARVSVCVAKAEQPSESRALAEFQASRSRVSQAEIVQRAGWATEEGATSTDSVLALACSAELGKMVKGWRFIEKSSVGARPLHRDVAGSAQVRAITP
jgi:hypothetical protein